MKPNEGMLVIFVIFLFTTKDTKGFTKSTKKRPKQNQVKFKP
jgi:hypothetical protein